MASSDEWRNWAELPHDVLSVIFGKLGAFEVLFPAQWVCRAWNRFSHEPALWRCVDMRFHADMVNVAPMEEIAMRAVDRAAGQLEGFYGENSGSDELLRYIADRTNSFRSLRLRSCYNISDEGLIAMANRSPLLEELEITLCSFGTDAYESIGRACSQLKYFGLNSHWYQLLDDYEVPEVGRNKNALAIANTMHELRHLQLIGDLLTNTGLLAILDNCPHLESLDIRCCFNVRIDGDLSRRLSRIKEVRVPTDSTEDCDFSVMADSPFDADYLSGLSEIDLMYDDMMDDFEYNVLSDDEYADLFY
ncbi:F-box and leucine-rich repeat protein 2/20 [Dioscorea alata]|uniref:F-box and leucine-rich repeat protein 2/20 n=1 Tax=Dioscorea alata TaxID=55571 RepID=A0ACB7U205_DIOAL|nr:F-box and leucine-rich repeat protein 2/20 [Dioscorea alata]